jgi:ABC-type transport system substrate-binding protein
MMEKKIARTRKFVFIALLVMVISMLFVSCGKDKAVTKTIETTEVQSAAAPSTAVGGGTVTVGYLTTVSSLSPHPYGASTYPFRDALYDPFIAIDDDGLPKPALAESWSLSEDELVLSMKLRSGVTFHDGTPFDTEAALANIEWFKLPGTKLQGGDSWAKITAVAVDANTIQLTFPQPMPEIFTLLSIALLSKPGAWDQGIGTGPFVLEEFTPRVELKFKKNEKYWDPSLPKIDHLILREFGDASAAGLVAEAGDLDILLGVKPNQVAGLNSAGLSVLQTPGPGNQDILVNSTENGITDSRVRRALSLAFDRQRYCDIIMKGFATPVSSIYSPASPVLKIAQKVTPFDLTAARALLDEAGVKNLEISIMSPTMLPTHSFLPIYKEDLAKIGVTLTIEPSDAATWAQAVAKPGSIPDAATHTYGFADLDPAMMFTAHPFRVGSNASGFISEEYARLVETAAATSDYDKRYAAYLAVDEYVKAEAFMFPIANAMNLDAVSARVEGFRRSHQTFVYKEISVVK